MTAAVTISGVGHHLPVRVEDNATLCQGLDVSPEWIVEKTGITQRHIAEPEESAADYAVEAGRRALAMAGVDADEVDLIIACTFSGDYVFPPLSARVQRDLRATNAHVFDVQANCTGFVTGLTIAADRMKADPAVRHALVIGVEFLSRYIDRRDVNTAIYLADGAGAAVLSRAADPEDGIRSSAFHTDSSNFESVRMRGGGSSFPLQGRTFDPAVDLMEMNGIATWKQAITHLPKVVRRACEKSGIELSTVDFLIFHQANLRLIEYLVRKLGFDLSRTYTNVERIGNTGSASLAIAMSEAVQRGLVKNGDLVVLAAVGAGFTFGASVWRWQLPAAERS
ncbi:3-oxoacyl-ACP synthase III family protein [Modestobacter sp. VKM Ac-2985]|uniref:3-oxoacyl-ACP synthase III family protein n=1 Tax=Modestobacter sp. VKM Ac-2985 TaxID=3004139 RepID=UPI0022ABC5E6|nr:beta-ketoacyl-ACP synthase 3 [Modestobacter sp. VKM Ac-2985]MCZ2836538.1 beta-ketoacyl-ACP synthase 3 [Modestobacter sp. VKM Ac-2985]